MRTLPEIWRRSLRRGALARACVASVLLLSAAGVSYALAAAAPAPTLSIKGTTLSWTAVKGATKYELKANSGGKAKVTYLTAQRYTITGEAPKTTYRVRAYAPVKGKWSKPVHVVNKSAKERAREKAKEEKAKEREEKAKEREEEAPHEEPKEKEPPHEEPPVEEEAGEVEREAIHFSPGISSGSDATYDIPGAASLGAKLVRLEVGYTQVGEAGIAQTSERYEAKGITPQILFGFSGAMPSAAQAKNITALARIPGIKRIEFGNETSYGYQYGEDGPSDASYKERARTYAIRFVEAAKALEPYHIGLLAQAGNGGTQSPVWVNEMFAAEPELTKYVSGWTIHPYGTHGPTEMSEMLSELAAHGDSSLPIDITEWGVASDNGRSLSNNYGFPVNVTYAQAGALLSEYVAKYRAQCAGRLRSFVVYQVRDQQPSGASTDREYYFGALQHEDQKKPGYTEAVEAVLKQS